MKLLFSYTLLYVAILAGSGRPSGGAKVKVMLLNRTGSDPNEQQMLESGPNLSIDLPQYELGSKLNASHRSASSNYHQISLASLTLQQPRSPRSSADQEANLIESPTSSDNKTRHNSSSSWLEIEMPRIKPSWLSIEKQFKITDSSIEEVREFVPNDYLLRPAFDSPILVRSKLGIIEGVRSIQFNKNLYTFLSVPYARPPIRELRFKAPQALRPWNGIYQATKWPPFCVQPSMTLASKSSPVHIMSQIMTEDCLYLNIWTPSLKLRREYRRPVMVWLHGGAFQYGGISVDENDGSALALLGDVVVVTLNYRVSAFGFLNANNKLNGPNNIGLLDQRMALEWVQANIKQFGGDPQQVTLFGESAGGHSVGLHLISPQSYHLFKRVILQSGVPTSMLRSYDANSDNDGPLMSEGATMVAKRLNCLQTNPTSKSDADNSDTESSSDAGDEDETETELEPEPEPEVASDSKKPILSDTTLDCMRNRSSLEILKALGAPGSSGFFPTGIDEEGFFPNGSVMQSFDPENLRIGPQKDFLIGTNTDEGTFMLHYAQPSIFPARDLPKVENIEQLRAIILNEIDRSTRDTSSNNETRVKSLNVTKSEIQSASGSSDGGAHAHLFRPLMRLKTSLLDRFMTSERNTTMDKRAEFGRTIGSLITDIIFLCPSRSLAKTLAESGRNVYFYLYGHRASTSQYHDWIGVTHHDEVEFVFGRPLRMADVYSGHDIEMSQRLIKTWTHFARTGQMLNQMGKPWPAYGQDENNYMRLNSFEASVGNRYHDKFCNLYDTVISVHLQDN